ncbi:hypothetical protein [Streptomyces sp. B6B3]|uniref:DUF7848 domain-containing protein n=1 Tax=Streptomyces sp. B6B3 TaxID=3153570 RepID=UPI00325E5720
MSRATYRFREYGIVPDERPEAEAWTYTMQCTACGVTGPTGTHPGQVTVWAAEHLKANRDHLSYREPITRPYRAEARAWQ